MQRERKLDVEWVNERIASLAQRGALICLFPEGTSSNGRHVLPFRSSLLEPAINKPVCPVWIRYETDEGSVGRDVAYWGDAVFALHLWRFLRLKRTRVYVHFASPMIRSDRKQIANDCWAQISELSRKTSTQPLEEIDHDLAISA